jgi:hypothetical protein
MIKIIKLPSHVTENRSTLHHEDITSDEAENTSSHSIRSCEYKGVTVSNAPSQYFRKKVTDKHVFRKVTKQKKWIFQKEHFSHENQMRMLKNIRDIHSPSLDSEKIGDSHPQIADKCEKVCFQEIQNKIAGYKYQDAKKNIHCPVQFVDVLYVLDILIESKLKCYYCNENVNIIYENKRDPKQWSLERINNFFGHNNNNVVIACLNCNLRRKTMMMQRYVETKKMIKVLKTDGTNTLFSAFLENQPTFEK